MKGRRTNERMMDKMKEQQVVQKTDGENERNADRTKETIRTEE